jgi:hypothetical protein
MCHLHCHQMFPSEQSFLLKSGAAVAASMKVVQLAAAAAVIQKLRSKFNPLVSHSQSLPAKVEAAEITSELMAVAVLLQETQCGAQAAAACREFSLALA